MISYLDHFFLFLASIICTMYHMFIEFVLCRYMLLPSLMGYFLMKNTVRERLRVVQESKVSW